MIKNINGGHVALVFIGLVFFGLQAWWISMTIRNGNNKAFAINQDQIDEIKKRLEKIFKYD